MDESLLTIQLNRTPATPPDTISLVLRKGTDTNLATLGTIAGRLSSIFCARNYLEA